MLDFNPEKYLPRLIDKKIALYLDVFGVICIEGPKWCGKTMTSLHHANSVFYLSNTAEHAHATELVRIEPSLALAGDAPHLIDEWQVVPELWDIVRSEVDRRKRKGQFILTGSSTPNRTGILHSGAGRFAKLRMRTMSLYESRDSSGVVSLKHLFEGNFKAQLTGEVHLQQLIHFIVRGGWPENLEFTDSRAALIPKEYIRLVISDDIRRVDEKRRDLKKIELLLQSLARNESTTCSMSTLRNDIIANGGKIDLETIPEYLNILEDLYLLDNQQPFAINLRLGLRLKQNEKRHFADPSLAVALLGASGQMLLNDLQTLGFLFESLCERDLRIYAEVNDGELFHYQDYDNDKIDAVVRLEDGRWGAFQIKLGAHQIDEAAKSLLKIGNKIEASSSTGKGPCFLCVLCGCVNAAYRREDGVYVVPITALRD